METLLRILQNNNRVREIQLPQSGERRYVRIGGGRLRAQMHAETGKASFVIEGPHVRGALRKKERMTVPVNVADTIRKASFGNAFMLEKALGNFGRQRIRAVLSIGDTVAEVRRGTPATRPNAVVAVQLTVKH